MLISNPLSGDIDAVAEPLAILGATNDGTFINLLPSPTKKDAVTAPSTFNEPEISTLPVNSEPLAAASTLNP